VGDEAACEAAGGRWGKEVDGYYNCSIAFFIFGVVRKVHGVE